VHKSASTECRLVLLVSAIVATLIDFAPCAQHLKVFFRSNLPEINHWQEKTIADPIISLARIFFRASILPATKKTDCTNAGAMLRITAMVGFAT
jgi:hypothetical protein